MWMQYTFGNIDHIQDAPYGVLVVELRGNNGGASSFQLSKRSGLKWR